MKLVMVDNQYITKEDLICLECGGFFKEGYFCETKKKPVCKNCIKTHTCLVRQEASHPVLFKDRID